MCARLIIKFKYGVVGWKHVSVVPRCLVQNFDLPCSLCIGFSIINRKIIRGVSHALQNIFSLFLILSWYQSGSVLLYWFLSHFVRH